MTRVERAVEAVAQAKVKAKKERQDRVMEFLQYAPNLMTLPLKLRKLVLKELDLIAK